MRRCSHSGRSQEYTQAAFAAGLVLLLLSACGPASGGNSNTASDGLTRVSSDVISFAYPKSWDKLPEEAYPQGWKVARGKNEDGGRAAEVAVFVKLPKTTEAKLAIEAVNSHFQFTQNFQRKRDRSINVPDAASAWRLDYSYDAKNSGEKILGTDVAVADDEGRVELLRITRRANGLGKAVVNRIVSSIEISSG